MKLYMIYLLSLLKVTAIDLESLFSYYVFF